MDKFFDDYCNSLSAYTGTLPSTAATIEKLPAESNAECTPSSQVRITNFPIVKNNTMLSMPLMSLWAQIDTFIIIRCLDVMISMIFNIVLLILCM